MVVKITAGIVAGMKVELVATVVIKRKVLNNKHVHVLATCFTSLYPVVTVGVIHFQHNLLGAT